MPALPLALLLLSLHACTCFLVRPARSVLRVRDVRTASTMSAGKTFSVGIVGATGAVGEEILGVLEKRNFPCSAVKLYASEKSAGKTVDSSVYGKLVLEEFSFESAAKLDVVVSAFRPYVRHGKCVCVCGSCWRWAGTSRSSGRSG